MMIHTINTINIRQYGEIDRTDNIAMLRRWWNVFPVAWFNTDLFFDNYNEIIGNNSNYTNDAYRILSYNKIIILNQIVKTMSILMKNQNDRSMFRLLFKREAKDYVGNFDYYVEKVKQITGIVIKDGNDLKALQKEIQRLLDKFHERFKDKQPQQSVEKFSFIDMVLGVFSIMEMAYVPTMKLSEFGRLKVLADKRIKAIEKSNGKH
jgi:hypothetical protein